MKNTQKRGRSRKAKALAKQLMDKDFHDSYLASQLKAFLVEQIKSLRGEMSQEEFGKLLGKPQSVVSRLEDPGYGKVTLQTLLDIASKLDVALIVRFADYSTYLRVINDTSPEALRPARFTPQEIKALAESEIRTPAPST